MSSNHLSVQMFSRLSSMCLELVLNPQLYSLLSCTQLTKFHMDILFFGIIGYQYGYIILHTYLN